MKRTLGLLALAATLILASAEAGYDVGSKLTADSPIQLSGRVDALTRDGVVSFVSADGRPIVDLSLTASEAALDLWEYRFQACAGFPPAVTCPTQSQPGPQQRRVEGATITIKKTGQPFKVIATNDPDYKSHYDFGTGALLVSAGGSTALAALERSTAITPFAEDWTEGNVGSAEGTPFYMIDERTPVYVAGGGQSQPILKGSGNFQLFLQGLEVIVKDASGNEQRYETTSDGSTSRFLRVEVRDAEMTASSAAPLRLFAPLGIDIPSPGKATFSNPEGSVSYNGNKQPLGIQASVPLNGPLALKEIVVDAKDASRLSFTLSSDLFLQDELKDEPPEDNNIQQLAVAGAIGAGSAGALAGLAYWWPRLRFAATLLLLPLYTRIERTEVLNHEKRDEIYELIRAAPGIHAHEIGEKARIGWGTTVYHLKMLENHSLVISKKSGRYKRFYVNTGEYTHKKDAYAALRNDTAKSVAQFIVEHPGCSQKELCTAIGIQPSLASWHVEKLEGVQLVKRVKDGRQVRYFAGPAWADLNVRVDPSGGAQGVAET